MLFHSVPRPDSDGDRLAYTVALYTRAAPTFFSAVDRLRTVYAP
jgi:hypothetical protein